MDKQQIKIFFQNNKLTLIIGGSIALLLFVCCTIIISVLYMADRNERDSNNVYFDNLEEQLTASDEDIEVTVTPETQINAAGDGNSISYYDPVQEGANNSNYLELSMEQSFKPSSMIFQTFESGQTMKLELPLMPFAIPTIIDQDVINGMRVDTEEYDLRLYHLIDVRYARIYCESALEESIIKTPFPDAADIVMLDTLIPYSAQFTTIPPQSKQYTIVQSCYPDGDTKVWLIEMYIASDTYEEKYSANIVNILDGFEFTE